MNPFVESLAESWPINRWQQERTIIACSGGADSVALVRAMHALAADASERLLVAHFNHRLRGDASAADEQFVIKLAGQLNLSCKTGQASTGELAKSGQDGLEAAARTARYAFLRDLANDQGARYIVTAHTADDQAETILHHILRGTGLSGLVGIPRTRQLTELTTIIRPMLKFSRSQVIDYLSSVNQEFHEDASNTDLNFTRNRLRHNLLPQLEREFNPQVREALLRLSTQAQESLAELDRATDDWFEQGIREAGPGQFDFQQSFFAGRSRTLLRHFLLRFWQRNHWPRQRLTADHWATLADILHDPVRHADHSLDLPGRIQVHVGKDLDCIKFQAFQSEQSESMLDVEDANSET